MEDVILYREIINKSKENEQFSDIIKLVQPLVKFLRSYTFNSNEQLRFLRFYIPEGVIELQEPQKELFEVIMAQYKIKSIQYNIEMDYRDDPLDFLEHSTFLMTKKICVGRYYEIIFNY